MNPLRCWKIAMLLFLALPLAIGCGRKGPVRPQSQPLPAAPEQLALRQQGDQVLLSWSAPRTNQDGSLLTDLAGFRILRMTYDPTEDCPDCRDTSVLLRQIDLEYLRETQFMAGRFFSTDTGLTAGQGYQYRIVPFNRWGQDGASVVERIALVAVPPAPEGPQAQALNGRIQLTWAPVANLPAGMDLLGYNVYRRRPGRPFVTAPLNRAPLTETGFEDRDAEPGITYLYAVRILVRQQDREMESNLSRAVVATP